MTDYIASSALLQATANTRLCGRILRRALTYQDTVINYTHWRLENFEAVFLIIFTIPSLSHDMSSYSYVLCLLQLGEQLSQTARLLLS